MEFFYTTVEDVAQSVEQLRQREHNWEMEVWDNDAKAVALTKDEARNRNILGYGECVCRLKARPNVELHFHEKHVREAPEAFELCPAGTDAIAPVQATQPDAFSSQLRAVTQRLQDHFDFDTWQFAGVEAKSMSNGGHFTDFEFEYEAPIRGRELRL